MHGMGLHVTDELRAVVQYIVIEAHLTLEPVDMTGVAGDLVHTIRLHVAIDLTFANQPAHSVQPRRHFIEIGFCLCGAIALDQLCQRNATTGDTGKAAVATTATPGDLVRFQNHCANAVLTGQVQGTAQSRIAGTNDRHLDIHVPADRTVILRRDTCGIHPIGSGMWRSDAWMRIDQRIVQFNLRIAVRFTNIT